MVELSFSEFRDKLNLGYSVIDIRSPQEFAFGFIPGSIFFSEDITTAQFGLFLSKGASLIIFGNYAGRETDIEELVSLGFNISGVYSGSIDDWRNAGLDIDMLIDVDAEELAMDLRFDQTLILVDTREEERYKHAHIKRAMNLPLPEMADVAQIASLDEEGCVYFYAMGDANAMLAGSLMKKQGLHNLRIVRGGWKAIVNEQSIEIEKETKPKK